MLSLQILGLIGLLLISLPLGRAKERARSPWMKWIPSLRFARLLLLDLLAYQLFSFLGQPMREAKQWIDHLRNLFYFLAVYDILVDYLWLGYIRFAGASNAPPKIFQDAIFVFGLALIIGGYLYKEGVVNGLGAAAFASITAFVIGPGTASQLQNLSSGLSIQAERQFEVGEWIE